MEPTIQRWSAKRKVELLLELIRGEKKLVDVCREHDLKQSEVEGWMDTFVKAGERGLKANAEDEAAAHEKELRNCGRRSASSCWSWTPEKNGRLSTAGTRRPSDVAERDEPGRQSGFDRAALSLVRSAAV